MAISLDGHGTSGPPPPSVPPPLIGQGDLSDRGHGHFLNSTCDMGDSPSRGPHYGVWHHEFSVLLGSGNGETPIAQIILSLGLAGVGGLASRCQIDSMASGPRHTWPPGTWPQVYGPKDAWPH